MADDASLRDTVVVDDAAATTTDTTTTTTDATTTTVDTAAEELGRLLMASGVTRENVNDVIAAPQALAAIRNAIQNDPEEFFKMVERSDPKAANKLMESVSDIYLKRNAVDDPEKPGQVKKIDPLMAEIQALKEQVSSVLNKEQQRDQAIALAATKQRYTARLDDMFGMKEIKDLKLTRSETNAMRARVGEILGSDPTIVQRASNGNFVDVPVAFKSVLEEWVGDKKAAVAEETASREKSKRNMFGELLSGPDFQNFNIPTTTFDSWDSTEDGFAKALESTSR